MTGAGRRLLVIIAADYESARRKGVDGLFLQYDEGGFFEKVTLISPYMREDECFRLSDRHDLRQFGSGARGRWRRLAAPVHVARIIIHACRIVRRERIAVIRATEPTLCGFIAWATARLTGVPYCVSLHADYDQRFALDAGRGAPALFGSRRLIRPLERLTLRGAAAVMPIRESLVAYALARGARRADVHVIPHGIDLAAFQQPVTIDVRDRLALPVGRKIVAFVGRLSRENYIDDLLDAARTLAERRDDFVVVLAGGGALEGHVAARLAADPVLARVVRPVGFVANDVVRALLDAAVASLCLMGGFSLIEACAAARPVVAYDVEWHHELVENDLTGRLVAEHDVAAVASAVAGLLDDAEGARRMGEEARRRAVARHGLPRAQAIKRRVYEEMLLRPSTAGRA